MNNVIQNIYDLPSINEVKKRSQGLALLDAIIMPEWDYRYFSFNCNWDGNGNEMMASMRDGSGNEYFLHFTNEGIAGKVFFEEGLADASLQLKNVPSCFSSFKLESAFGLNNAPFFFWKTNEDEEWSVSPKHINVYPLLGFLIVGHSGYHEWAESYYEKNICSNVVKDVFTSLNISSEQLAVLNPELSFEKLAEDLQEIIGD